jgi:peptidoglycan/xylan/chitin deacetylase (PgdA/CDA1 family)
MFDKYSAPIVTKILKFIVAAAFYYSGLLWLWLAFRERRSTRPLILMYHRILNEDDDQMRYAQRSLVVSERIFASQMAFLVRKYNFIPLSKLADALIENRTLPKWSLVITFDDGWRDNFSCAFPVLQIYKIPATIFLTVNYIESNRTLWFLRIGYILASNILAPEKIMKILSSFTGGYASPYPGDTGFMELLKKYKMDVIENLINRLSEESSNSGIESSDSREMLNWNEIVSMKQFGVDFGSHGLSHSILTLLSPAEIKEELCLSKMILEEKIGEKVLSFAYPNGNHDPKVRSLVREAGYKCALATNASAVEDNSIDPFMLGRIGIHNDISTGPFGNFSKSLLMFHISGLYDILRALFGRGKEI